MAIVKGERGFEPVFKALDLIDYESALAGYKKVLIKVNFITTMTWDTGATTDPIVVEAVKHFSGETTTWSALPPKSNS